jgi:hypothetical protein
MRGMHLLAVVALTLGCGGGDDGPTDPGRMPRLSSPWGEGTDCTRR